MNRLFLEKDGLEIEHVRAEEVWAIGRALGVSYDGNEQEVLKWITNMEKRDKAEWEERQRAEEAGQELIQRDDVDLVFFPETKLTEVFFKLCLSLWRFESFEWKAKGAQGSAGGFCIWDSALSVLATAVVEVDRRRSSCDVLVSRMLSDAGAQGIA
ncbi:hypothetical protein Ancab_031109 [Ancistrocladus abbreviatus]